MHKKTLQTLHDKTASKSLHDNYFKYVNIQMHNLTTIHSGGRIRYNSNKDGLITSRQRHTSICMLYDYNAVIITHNNSTLQDF